MKKVNRKEVELFKIENISYAGGIKDNLILKLVETIVACMPNQSFFVSTKDLNNNKAAYVISNLRYRIKKDSRLKGSYVKTETVKQHGSNEIIGIRIYRIK